MGPVQLKKDHVWHIKIYVAYDNKFIISRSGSTASLNAFKENLGSHLQQRRRDRSAGSRDSLDSPGAARRGRAGRSRSRAAAESDFSDFDDDDDDDLYQTANYTVVPL